MRMRAGERTIPDDVVTPDELVARARALVPRLRERQQACERQRRVPQDAELRKLQKEVRTLRMERDILKKAIAYFAEVPK